MASLDTTQQTQPSKTPQKIERADSEEEDKIESYISAMKKKGVEVGKGKNLSSDKNEDEDSDEEVYRTAREIDAQTGSVAIEDDESLTGAKKNVEPLSKVDHDKILYIEMEKNQYEEHADITALSACRNSFRTPSGIQRQAVPVALSGRDLIGIAKTGSGKTAAYIWPMIYHIIAQPPLENSGPIGLILAPTRELASQIQIEVKKFCKPFQLRSVTCYGGVSKLDQFKTLRSGHEIVIATPGRLIDMIRMKAITLTRVSYLVLDECDRMFDLGFEEQVFSICRSVRPDRQTLLFSATFPRKIENLARMVLIDPVKITVGNVGVVNDDIEQVPVILQSDLEKWGWLVGKLAGAILEGSVLIFVSTKAGCDELTKNLKLNGFDLTNCLHGDMQQYERDQVVKDFRKDKIRVLVCTDVAARGLDIKTMSAVIHFDVAKDIESHVHRVGRTGRAGEKGVAYSLITQKDERFAGELVRSLEIGGKNVPSDLLQVAMKNPRFAKFRSGNRGRDRGRGRGGARSGGTGAIGTPNANITPVGGSRGFSFTGGVRIDQRDGKPESVYKFRQGIISRMKIYVLHRKVMIKNFDD
ncbi:hypothetical protein HK098_008270 [Nowakowskiella sp. JEL0407]|nr:hypothetical protein HK098_008270 [Nowakowskiella sp. JEL0407]